MTLIAALPPFLYALAGVSIGEQQTIDGVA